MWNAIFPIMGNQLKRLRESRRWTHDETAEKFGVSRSGYIKLERGERKLTGQHIAKASEIYGVSSEDVLAETVPGRLGSVRVTDLAIFSGMGGGGALEVSVNEFGEPSDPEQIRGFWEFPEYMVRRFGDLRNIYAWESKGDSMEPTIVGGSVVFVDVGQSSPPPDDIYAVNYGDGLVVKRLKLIPRTDRVAVISDNDRYGSDELLREEVKVWGRVVGWFQWRG